MKTLVYKYELQPAGKQLVEIPCWWEVFSAVAQGDNIVLYAGGDENALTEAANRDVEVLVLPTGKSVETDGHSFLSTVTMTVCGQRLVFHVFIKYL